MDGRWCPRRRRGRRRCRAYRQRRPPRRALDPSPGFPQEGDSVSDGVACRGGLLKEHAMAMRSPAHAPGHPPVDGLPRPGWRPDKHRQRRPPSRVYRCLRYLDQGRGGQRSAPGQARGVRGEPSKKGNIERLDGCICQVHGGEQVQVPRQGKITLNGASRGENLKLPGLISGQSVGPFALAPAQCRRWRCRTPVPPGRG